MKRIGLPFHLILYCILILCFFGCDQVDPEKNVTSGEALFRVVYLHADLRFPNECAPTEIVLEFSNYVVVRDLVYSKYRVVHELGEDNSGIILKSQPEIIYSNSTDPDNISTKAQGGASILETKPPATTTIEYSLPLLLPGTHDIDLYVRHCVDEEFKVDKPWSKSVNIYNKGVTDLGTFTVP